MGTTMPRWRRKRGERGHPLTQQVEQNGQDIRSNTDSITSLSNQLVNGQPNSWSRRIYPVQLANAGQSRHSAIFAPWRQWSWMRWPTRPNWTLRPPVAI
ncbi:hypothetical protein F3Y20_26765 [Klebsiella pneumoniae]|nr:hypothetical protein F3Y20_26765 [Klebsiella pneumoniae]